MKCEASKEVLAMTYQIRKCDVPKGSKISETLNGSYYFDAYCFPNMHGDRTALQVWLDQVSSAPDWVNLLMSMRNNIVSVLGLKNLGSLGDIDSKKPLNNYRVGDRVGIFKLLSLSDNEIILGDSDKHLDVKLSVFRESTNSELITISTVVHVHNLLGRVYMLVVTPMHKLIVPSTIKRAEFQ